LNKTKKHLCNCQYYPFVEIMFHCTIKRILIAFSFYRKYRSYEFNIHSSLWSFICVFPIIFSKKCNAQHLSNLIHFIIIQICYKNYYCQFVWKICYDFQPSRHCPRVHHCESAAVARQLINLLTNIGLHWIDTHFVTIDCRKKVFKYSNESADTVEYDVGIHNVPKQNVTT
jgi:hypothetical protein